MEKSKREIGGTNSIASLIRRERVKEREQPKPTTTSRQYRPFHSTITSVSFRIIELLSLPKLLLLCSISSAEEQPFGRALVAPLCALSRERCLLANKTSLAKVSRQFKLFKTFWANERGREKTLAGDNLLLISFALLSPLLLNRGLAKT